MLSITVTSARACVPTAAAGEYRRHRVVKCARGGAGVASTRPPTLAPGFAALTANRGAQSPGVARGMAGDKPRDLNSPFLTLEEAGLVEFAPIDMHEKFLARLTVSSLNLLRIIAEEEKCTIEELNAGRIADWFTKDVQRKETDPDSAVLKW